MMRIKPCTTEPGKPQAKVIDGAKTLFGPSTVNACRSFIEATQLREKTTRELENFGP